MFLPNSRYHTTPQTEVDGPGGRRVRVVKIRDLPDTPGTPVGVKEHDRLDLFAERRYDDPTRFWHVADANSELDARRLTAVPGRLIRIPDKP